MSTAPTLPLSQSPPPKPTGGKGLSAWFSPTSIIKGLLVLNVVAILVARLYLVEQDVALANLITGGALIGCAFWIWLWFILFSGYPMRARMIGVVASGVFLVAAFRVVREVRFNGNMIPKVYWSWQPVADRSLAAPVVLERALEPTPELEQEVGFPQFLGPKRTGYLSEPKLAHDWKARPPKELWRQKIGAGWSGFVARGGLAVTQEQRGEDELVTCYEASTGNVVWWHGMKARHDEVMGGVGPRSTPVIHEGKVYTLGATGILHCLDLRSGEVIWQDDLVERGGTTREKDSVAIQWGRCNSPLIFGNKLIVPLGGTKESPTSLIAYDNENGEVLWKGGHQQIGYASPTAGLLAGREQIVTVNESSVSGHDPESGEELWRYDWFGESNARATASQAHLLTGDRLFISKGYQGGAKVLQITNQEGKFNVEVVWENPKVLKTKFTNCVVIGDYVYGLSDGVLECVELASGKSQWRKGRYGQGQILGVGDCILVQAEAGDVVLAAANPDQFQELGRISALHEKTWNNLCLYQRLLLVRNSEEAVCYELEAE